MLSQLLSLFSVEVETNEKTSDNLITENQIASFQEFFFEVIFFVFFVLFFFFV